MKELFTRPGPSVCFAVAALVLGCTGDFDDDFGEDTTQVRVFVTGPDVDALPSPAGGDARVEEVQITLAEIEARHSDLGWFELRDEAVVFTLLNPQPVAQELGRGQIPDGVYDRMLLSVRPGAVVVDGESLPLEIVSDNGDVEFDVDFCLDQPTPAELTLSWDIEEGLRFGEEEGYTLVPVISLVDPPQCGVGTPEDGDA